MSLLVKNYSLIEVTFLLISFNKAKSFLWNTKNTDRNDVNKQNTDTNQTLRKITLERVSLYENKWNPHFYNRPLFYQPISFYEKNLKPHSLEKFWKLNSKPPFIKGRMGGGGAGFNYDE